MKLKALIYIYNYSVKWRAAKNVKRNKKQHDMDFMGVPIMAA